MLARGGKYSGYVHGDTKECPFTFDIPLSKTDPEIGRTSSGCLRKREKWNINLRVNPVSLFDQRFFHNTSTYKVDPFLCFPSQPWTDKTCLGESQKKY